MYLSTFEPDDFVNKFLRIRKATALPLKEKFFQAFCAVNSHRYERYLSTPGAAVWGAMSYNFSVVTKEDLNHSPPFTGNVYIGWDYPDIYVYMYGLGRYYLFQMPFSKYLAYYESFPENTYFFDDNFEYAIVSSLEFDKWIPKVRLYSRVNHEVY